MIDRISFKDANSRVGQAIYGKEWIGELPPRQHWPVQCYGFGAKMAENNSMLPARVAYVPNLGRNDVRPIALRQEIEIAQDRFEYMQMQHKVVKKWLDENGFDTCAKDFDLSKLEDALKAIPGKRRPGRQKLPEEQIAAEINSWYNTHPKIGRGRGKEKCVTDLNHRDFGKQSDLRRIHDDIFGQPKPGRPPIRGGSVRR